jgi:nucleotide-binding universal stress UspA family protein
MKKILFPTDFSKSTEKAFVYALNLAKQLDATITTLHAYEKPDVGAFVLPTSLQRFYDGIDWNEFENYQDTIPSLRKIALENQLESIEINHAMIEGETLEVIQKTAVDYDLIVMGTAGASVLKEVFWGTVSGEVMEIAPCPVVVIPEQAVFDGKINKIAVTIEFSEEDGKVLKNVLKLAHILDAKVEAIHIDIKHTGQLTNQIQAFRDAFSHIENLRFTELEGEGIVETIATYAENTNIDLITMVTHKRTFWGELFNYSHAKQMTYQHKIPVFAIPESVL